MSQIRSSDSLLPINVLWIGGALSKIEQLSILSFIRAGHHVRLHAYDDVGDIPSDVELVDAELTVPRKTIQELRYYRTGSYAVSADYFRIVLQSRSEGIWADLDMLCLRPIEPSSVAFGLEIDGRINNALLYLDAKLPIIEDFLGLFRNDHIPPWVDDKIARKRRLKRWLPGRKIRPAIMPWGPMAPGRLHT